MDSSNYPISMAAQEPIEQKQSGFGIASLIVGVIALLFVCGTFGLSFYSQNLSSQAAENITSLVGATAICSLVIGLVGLGFGIAGVVQKTNAKTTAIAGLILNVVAFLSMCGIIALGLAISS